MPGEKDPRHVKQGNDRPVDDVEARDREARNERIGAERGMGMEEPRDIHEAGGGTRGASQGGAHTGRYDAAPGKVRSHRERKPRGEDKV